MCQIKILDHKSKNIIQKKGDKETNFSINMIINDLSYTNCCPCIVSQICVDHAYIHTHTRTHSKTATERHLKICYNYHWQFFQYVSNTQMTICTLGLSINNQRKENDLVSDVSIVLKRKEKRKKKKKQKSYLQFGIQLPQH